MGNAGFCPSTVFTGFRVQGLGFWQGRMNLGLIQELGLGGPLAIETLAKIKKVPCRGRVRKGPLLKDLPNTT